MPRSQPRSLTSRLPLALVTVVALSVLMPRPSVAEGSSFFGWLFGLLLADETPAKLTLSDEDTEHILKTELWLQTQDPRLGSPTTCMVVGILAAARGDEGKATTYFRRAADLDRKSALALTALGQTFLQQGKPGKASELHTEAEKRIRQLDPRASLLLANSYLDLAVAHAMIARHTSGPERRRQLKRAAGHAREAIRKLDGIPKPGAREALVYLQAGTVYSRVLSDPSKGPSPKAIKAWKRGLVVVEKGAKKDEEKELPVRLAVQLNFNLARSLEDADQSVEYLEKARGAAEALSRPSRTRAHEQYVRIVGKMVPKLAKVNAVTRKKLLRALNGIRMQETKAPRLQYGAVTVYAKLLEKQNPRDPRIRDLGRTADQIHKKLQDRWMQRFPLTYDERSRLPLRKIPKRPGKGTITPVRGLGPSKGTP